MKSLFAALLIIFPILANSTFEDGVDAFLRGDYKKSLQEWEPLANAGDADAARNLGRLYQQGLGVKQNFIEARRWYKVAASKCNATAQNNLGLMMLNGQGGPKDLVGAFRMFERAAFQGLHEDAEAMGNLASMYMNGTGTQKNVIEAYKWFFLYREYSTNQSNKKNVTGILYQVEKSLTETQKAEALRRARSFKKIRCIP